MKPKVFIALASSILGGPGKGLKQFLVSGGLEKCEPLVVEYRTDASAGPSEYGLAMRSTGARVEVLRQKKRFDPGLVEQSLRLIRENGIEILQSHGYKSHVLCWILRRKTGLPWIAFVHGWTREDWKIRVYTLIEHVMLLLADEVVAVSGSLRQKLLPPVRRRCRVIPNAVAPEELAIPPEDENMRRRLGIPADALLAGVVGRLSPEKGQSVFVRALAVARQREPRLYGLLVGDGQEAGRLHDEVCSLGLEPYCLFTGHVQGLGPYYGSMDMLVLPSFAEGMPNVALEGMLMGLPVVACRVGGVPEVVVDKETGVLIAPGDVTALAQAMLELAASADLRRRLGEAGRDRMQREFTPQVRVERFMDLYRQTLQSGREPAA